MCLWLANGAALVHTAAPFVHTRVWLTVFVALVHTCAPPRFVPPLIVSEEEIAQALEIFSEAVGAAK